MNINEMAAALLTRLNAEEMDLAMRNAGYYDNGLTKVQFLKLTHNGRAQYRITYDTGEGQVESGLVYVSWNAASATFRADI